MSAGYDSVPFAPPPPAPPPLPDTSVDLKVNSINPSSTQESEHEVIAYIEKLYSHFAPEIKELPPYFCYKHLISLIQDGPTCGLVALSMISSCTGKMVSPSELLTIARQRGFTKKGEMFSASRMALLASHAVSDVFDIQVNSGGLLQNKLTVINNLLHGHLYLVPYDADKNHTPANLKGLKAHWAVLCGVVKDSRNCYVIGKQSKSKHVALWNFDELHESNMNLTEISVDKTESGDYVIEDIRYTLAGHYILFKNKTSVIS